MTNGAMTTTQGKVATIRDLLEKSKQQIAMALPKHCTPDRLARMFMTTVQRTPKLLDCEPKSLLGAFIQASQLGLEPDGILGHAYFIPYGKVCQLIPGYKGLIDLSRRSGELSTIDVRIVHEKDDFAFHYGLDPDLHHTPSHDEPGEMIAAYAVARLRDSGVQFEVMWKREIDKIRDGSKASKNGPWVTYYEEMAKKTVLRRLCKLLPTSVELQKAVALDEMEAANIDQKMDTVVDFQANAKQMTTLDALAEDIDNQQEPNSEPTPEPLDSTKLSMEECQLLDEYYAAFKAAETINAVKQLGNTAMSSEGFSDVGREKVKAACDSRIEAIRGKRGAGSNER